MTERQQRAPTNIYWLADHLDSALAACEDLLNLAPGEPAELLRLELTTITHLLQARQRIGEIYVGDTRLQDQAVLFLAGTAPLELKEFVKAAPQTGPLVLDEAYPVGGRLSISLVRDLAGQLLDALEYQYVIYDDDKAEDLLPSFLRAADEIWTQENRP
jgi:hypothetical protein